MLKHAKASSDIDTKHKEIKIEYYKFNKKFATNKYLKSAFSLFRYIQMIAFKDINGVATLDNFLSSTKIVAKSFILSLSRNKDIYYNFLDQCIEMVELVDLVNDYNLESIKKECRSFLNIDFKMIEYYKDDHLRPKNTLDDY